MTFRAIDPAVAKIYYAEEADRPITTLNIPDGSLVIFTDSGLEDSFDAVSNAWFNREQITQSAVGKTAGLMVAELSNLANTIGLYTPARDVLTQWAFGADDTFSAALTPATPTTGLAMDARHINTGARSILIIAGGTTNYDYEILAGRNNIEADAASIVTVAAVTTTNTLINIPDSFGYAPWLFLKVTNNSGNATYKSVLLGKGG